MPSEKQVLGRYSEFGSSPAKRSSSLRRRCADADSARAQSGL